MLVVWLYVVWNEIEGEKNDNCRLVYVYLRFVLRFIFRPDSLTLT